MAAGGAGEDYVPTTGSHGHYFVKKTFHKPTYCHHCQDLLWGLIGQGYVCEVCNFVVHDRCLKTVVSPCTSIAAALIETPVAHFWAESTHQQQKRRFCNVCRKRLDDTCSFRCEICEYHAHAECQDGAAANCRQAASYVPGRVLADIKPAHHWREGNLSTGAKCVVCKKSCWSTECLSGWKCEWCGVTAHSACYRQVHPECNYGTLAPIMLPPHAVSMPRTSLAIETIIGFVPRRRDTLSPRSISEDFSSGGESKTAAGRDGTEESSGGGRERDRDRSREREDREEEVIKVFDGNASLRHNVYKLISLSRYVTAEQLLAATLWAFHITADPAGFYLTDAYGDDDKELINPHPITSLTRLDGKRPAVLLRFRQNIDTGWVRVHAGRLKVSESPKLVPVTTYTTIEHLIEESLPLFCLEHINQREISVCEVILDKGGVSERVASNDEVPWENLKQIGNESLHQMQMTRFYLQPKEDPHGPNVAVFVGNLPPNLSQRQYENILMDSLGKENRFVSVGPIYYEYGSMVITYKTSEAAIQACECLRSATYENDKKYLVVLLPNIIPHLIPPGVVPLLVFVNVKSGGCQGLELVTNFRKLLNPYQVYDLDIGGPLPGLYVFRHVRDYRILVCGGDGTIGWVLQCLDNVGQDSECSSPPCAIVPLGTGNDLARVLRWGPGYTGGEDPMTLLRDVIDAEEIRLDRWTVVFHPEEKSDKDDKTGISNSTGSTNEDNTQIFVMNNYFGIGIDADLCLDFHNAREENPNKFNSRLHNKGVYVKMGLRKMMGRKLCKDLYKEIRLEVDGKLVELPPVEGIIILNILSWGSGANPWGPEREESFSKPNHWDGMLEVVGVTGVLHLGQIQSGLRSAIRIAQGGHIKIKMFSEMPIQVDGEPWVQGSGEIVVLKSALKATMLKKVRAKVKRRNTDPFLALLPTSANPQSLPSARSEPANTNRPLGM